MDTQAIKTFIQVANLGSFTKASEVVGYTQSGISHMMQSLEEEVGFPLMVRSSSALPSNFAFGT